jgi:rare lipoprotein A
MRGVIQKDPVVSGVRALVVVLCASTGLAACATGGKPPRYVVSGPPSSAQTPPPSAGLHGTMKPYEVNGRWYTPHADPAYDEVGVASWYGAQFHYHRTANGEVFDQYVASAAHTTLPIPSIIEVTNLANNRTIRVRLNDRGPFVDGRILDLSREAAAELGYEKQGVARVRVRYIGPAPTLPTTRVASAADVTTPATRGAGDIEDQDFPVARAPVLLAAARPSKPPDNDIEVAPFNPPSAPARGAAITTTAVDGPPPPAPVASAHGYLVQVGAFSSRDTAGRIAQRLGGAGQTAITPIQRNGATLYRLTVGAYPDASTAAAARARVVAQGLTDARVVGPQ